MDFGSSPGLDNIMVQAIQIGVSLVAAQLWDTLMTPSFAQIPGISVVFCSNIGKRHQGGTAGYTDWLDPGRVWSSDMNMALHGLPCSQELPTSTRTLGAAAPWTQT